MSTIESTNEEMITERKRAIVRARINVKSLANEARDNRKEKRKQEAEHESYCIYVQRGIETGLDSKSSNESAMRANAARVGRIAYDLDFHRTKKIRPEARAAQWALAALRGRGYSTIEQSPIHTTHQDFSGIAKRFRRKIAIFTSNEAIQAECEDWLRAAEAHHLAVQRDSNN